MEYSENVRRAISRMLEDDVAIRSTIASAETENPSWADELVRLGLIDIYHGSVLLTEKGRGVAVQSIRQHRLAERLLSDVLVIPAVEIHEHACRFEQTLVPGLEEAICTLLGHPRYCPHGRSIPQGTCCLRKDTSIRPVVFPLAEMKPGEYGQIAYIYMHEDATLQKLVSMGLFPGTAIRLLNRAPSFIFEVGNSRFAVDEEIAANVFIRTSSAVHSEHAKDI